MRNKLLILGVILVISCTDKNQNQLVNELYSESLDMVLANNPYLLLEYPSPTSNTKPVTRSYQVSNKLNDLSNSLKLIEDESIDISDYDELTAPEFIIDDMLQSNGAVTNIKIVDRSFNDKKILEEYLEEESQADTNFGGLFILGTAFINKQNDKAEIIVPIAKVNLGTAKFFAVRIKVENRKVVKVEELKLLSPID